MAYHKIVTLEFGSNESAVESDISLVTLKQDVGYSSPARPSDGADVSPHPSAETKMTDFPNEKLNFFKVVADILAVLLPFSLLAFIVAIHRLNGKEVDRATLEKWQNAVRVTSTLFPIIFSSVVGRLMYEISRWKLESGSSMRSLEQLLGSRSVGSVVTTQIHFRALNSLGLSLLLIWAFSPLGSQSILRILGSRLEPLDSTTNVTYYDNLHESGFAGLTVASPGSQEGTDAYFQYLNALFSATLLTAETTKLDTMDHWGNVKIPFLSTSDTGSEDADAEWQEISPVPNFERYSSLAGIPVAHTSSGNTTLSIESTYIELACYNITKQQSSSAGLDISWTWVDIMGTQADKTPIPENGTWEGITNENFNYTVKWWPTWFMAVNRFVDYYWVNETAQDERRGPDKPWSDPDDPSRIWHIFDNSPERFVNETGLEAGPTELLLQTSFSAHRFGTPNIIEAQCNVRQRYVESRVSCEQPDTIATGRNCTVTAHRPSQKPHVTELITHLNFPLVWAWLSLRLPRAGTFGGSGRPDMALQYLNDPSINRIDLTNADSMFSEIDKKAFSRRLSQILNTYLYLSQVYLSAPGGSLGDSWLDRHITLPVTSTVLIEIYAINMPWIAAGVVSCAVLLLGGVLSVMYRHMVAGPEVLGYASSIVRDSKYINLQFDSSKLNGLDITKMMENQRVRYGFTDLTKDGQLLVGVGLEEETTRIKDKARLL